MSRNIDLQTVSGFGYQWSRFTHAELDPEEKQRAFMDYFRIFPWHLLPSDGGVGADIGCGNGRWSTLVAPRVSHLHMVEASAHALQIAKQNLSHHPNVSFHCATIDDLPFPEQSLDFAFALGVLHHVPDPQRAVAAIARKLKPGAPFLAYVYYALDNRPMWFRLLWKLSDIARRCICRLPNGLRYYVSQLIAAVIYWPLARVGRILEKVQCLPDAWPLAYYRDKSFYVMRTDALDRFGTRLEKRFTRRQIQAMLESAGFTDVSFSEHQPYWCVVGIRSSVG
ncbi:MAG: class I SAM-dependent methyltransferase [Acidobacteriota bacterium]|nr:class I SAM-dependent methyltransferase [Acidobacteriota bacterium]